MEVLALVALVVGAFLALYTSEYWGPGLRNILNAIATRITGKEPAVDNGPRKSWWNKALLALAVPGALAACIAIWEWLFG